MNSRILFFFLGFLSFISALIIGFIFFIALPTPMPFEKPIDIITSNLGKVTDIHHCNNFDIQICTIDTDILTLSNFNVEKLPEHSVSINDSIQQKVVLYKKSAEIYYLKNDKALYSHTCYSSMPCFNSYK